VKASFWWYNQENKNFYGRQSMSEQGEFGFCPKCGAIMQNGVCRSCGYGKGIHYFSLKEETSDKPVQRHKGSSRAKIATGLGVVLGVFIFLAVAGLIVFITAFSITGGGKRESKPNDEGFKRYYDYYDDYEDDYDYDDDDYDGEYKPDKDDKYYEEITDATSLDLNYQVLWKSESIQPEDPEDNCHYDCVYPVFTGEDAEKFAAMNEQIHSLASKYENSYQEYSEGVSSSGYVTYMDEEKFSVVIQYRLKDNNMVLPRLAAISFSVDTGKMLLPSDMAVIDMELVKQFRYRNSYQNGEVDYISDSTDEELLKCLLDEEKSVMFYTPVGLEIGFNYDGEENDDQGGGWVTVTLKDTII